jgi:hypothetical protein
MKETVIISADRYYIAPLFPFMPEEIYRALEQACFKDYRKVRVPKRKYDKMMKKFLDSMKN